MSTNLSWVSIYVIPFIKKFHKKEIIDTPLVEIKLLLLSPSCLPCRFASSFSPSVALER